MTINIGIIKSLSKQERIKLFKIVQDDRYYWLPIENDNNDFNRLFSYLKKCNICQSANKVSKEAIKYTLFDITEPIPMFPYSNKKNGGDGLIYHKMMVDKIIYSSTSKLKIINEQLNYDSMYREANIWLRIMKCSKLGIRGYRLEDNFKPFLPQARQQQREKFYVNFDYDKDYIKLSNYMIVQDYNHQKEKCCCLMCR